MSMIKHIVEWRLGGVHLDTTLYLKAHQSHDQIFFSGHVINVLTDETLFKEVWFFKVSKLPWTEESSIYVLASQIRAQKSVTSPITTLQLNAQYKHNNHLFNGSDSQIQ